MSKRNPHPETLPTIDPAVMAETEILSLFTLLSLESQRRVLRGLEELLADYTIEISLLAETEIPLLFTRLSLESQQRVLREMEELLADHTIASREV